jgi:uncharacterized membrane protein YidH (DUF202 family)
LAQGAGDRAMSSGGGTGGTEAREHLANERTLLAWVRTGVSLISFGLVIERIGAQVGSVGTSGAFGIARAVLGCLALVMGTVQFLRSRRGMSHGQLRPRRRGLHNSCGREPGPRRDVHNLHPALCLGVATSGRLGIALD